MIEYFDLESLYQNRSGQKFIKKVINSRGASGQKVVQLIDSNENVELKSDKQVINYCTETLKNHKKLFGQLEKVSKQYLAGSMAYVFKARISGIEDWVAIKVLRKDIEEKIEKELKTSSFLSKNLNGIFNSDKFSQLEKFSSTFIKDLILECNLIDEEKNQRTFKRLLKDMKHIAVPAIHGDYSSKNILCYEWIEPTLKSIDYSRLNMSKRNELSHELKSIFITKALRSGIVQEDSNPANFIYSNEKLYFIDFGKVFKIPLRLRIALCYFIYKIRNDEEIDYIYHYGLLGYDISLMNSIKEYLPAITEILLSPFLSPHLKMEAWDVSEKLKVLLGESVWILRSAGSYDNFKLTRSLLGFFKVLNHLDVNISCKVEIEELFQDYLEDFTILDTRNKKPDYSYNSVLDQRKIEILVNTKGGKKTKVTLPIRALYSLKEFISHDIYKNIKSEQSDISLIIKSGLNAKPGDVILDSKLREKSFKIKVTL